MTVDLCALGKADEDERSHCRTTAHMTNDSVVADAFCPYRCARDYNHISLAGGRLFRGAQEHARQFCEVLVTAVKVSFLHPDRREPSQLMTLALRNDDEQEEDSGLDEDEAPADHQRTTETPPGLHTTTRELQTCTFERPALQTPPKIHEKTPRERRKERIFRREREKSAKFWAPHPSGPHFFWVWASHPSGLPPSWPPLSLGLGPPACTPP